MAHHLITYLANELHQLGFAGLDVSPEISLGEYKMMTLTINDTTILVNNYGEDEDTPGINFDWGIFNIDDIKEKVNRMPEGFYNFIGATQDECNEHFSIVNMLYDLETYDGYVSQELNPCNKLYAADTYEVDEIVENIKGFILDITLKED